MDIARTAALAAGLPDTVAGVQLNRFCASGLEAVNMAAQKVRSGWEDLVLAGGVESMSRVPMGSDGGAWAMDPETNYGTGFVPQGICADLIATMEGFTRTDVDAYAVAVAGPARPRRGRTAASTGRSSRCATATGSTVLDRDEHLRPAPPWTRSPGCNPSFAAIGEAGGFDAVALQRYHWVERIDHVHHAGNSSGIVDGAALVLVGTEGGERCGLTPRARIVPPAVAGSDPTIMLTGPAPATRKALAKAGLTVEDIDLVRGQRGLRRGGRCGTCGTWAVPREGQRQRRRDRHGPPARRHRRDDPRHAAWTSWSAASCATAWSPCASAAAWASPPIVERV